MQYKNITAIFALLASAAMAMPVAAPADAGALVARNGPWEEQYPEVESWLPYRKPNGLWCRPEDDEYSYSQAYSAKSYTSYGYRSGSGDLQARDYNWHQRYPNVENWLPYQRQNGAWCRPEDSDYSYSIAYSSSAYTSYSESHSEGH